MASRRRTGTKVVSRLVSASARYSNGIPIASRPSSTLSEKSLPSHLSAAGVVKKRDGLCDPIGRDVTLPRDLADRIDAGGADLFLHLRGDCPG